MRTDIRWPEDSPVTALLAGIPRNGRAELIRSIVEAALIPGGWARIANGRVQLATGADAERSTWNSTPQQEPDAGSPPAVASSDGMSSAGRASFLEGLRQFGAELDP